MKNQAEIYVVHGVRSSPSDAWFPWLKEELAKKGHNVVILDMPNPDSARRREWLPFLKEKVKPSRDTYLIGHSIGGHAVLNYLTDLPKGEEIGGAVFVACGLTQS